MKRRLVTIAAATLGLLAGGAVAVLAATSTITVKAASPQCATNAGAFQPCSRTISVAQGAALTITSPVQSTTGTTTPSTTTTTPTTTTSTTPTTTTTTTMTTTPPPPAGSWWTPPQTVRWYWQLQGTVPIRPNIDATDMDGFDNTAATVAAFHAAGQHAICYIDVGTWENWRSDAGQFPAGLLGNGNGWPGEKWLDVRPSGPYYAALQAIMDARFQMCQQKGFDAVEPDNMDSWDGNNPGFPTTSADQAAYNEWIAQDVHRYGMAVFQKNDPNQAATLQPYFDGVISEQAFQYGDDYSAYEQAGKPHLDAEYRTEPCHSPPTVMQAQFSVNLDGSVFTPCW